MKVRLIDPAYHHPILGHSQKVMKNIWFAHLTLTTLAALTPPEIKVEITDENVGPINFEEEVDLVGITGMIMHASRAYEIAHRFRQRGIPVVMGGPHASSLPLEAKEHVDAVVIGEAEMVWKELLEDLRRGSLKPFYRAESFHSMKGLARPRLDLLKKDAYMTINCVQTTRGCPHRCDFCYVTHFFGNTYRCRPVEEVIQEVRQLEGEFIVFVDDNIAGDRRYAKELFTQFKPLKKKWAGQASLTLTRDPELLRLAAESGCVSLFIGVESLSPENLKGVNKSFNRVPQFEEAIRILHNHDIMILASFIVGLDHDDEGVFEKNLRFCERNRIELPSFFILTPLPGTPLFKKMEQEGRLLHRDWTQYNGATVVFKPNLMTEETLQQGFQWLCKEAYSWTSIIKRVFRPQQRFYTRILSNLAYRSIAQRAPESSLPSLSKILQGMNDTIPLQNTRDLIQRMEEKIVEKKVFISQREADALQLYSVYNEQLKTLFIRLEGSIDRKGAKELAKRLKHTICEKVDQVILDFKDIGAFSSEAMAFLSRKGFLRKDAGSFWVAINIPDQKRTIYPFL
ncbi:MAG: radical SAM protein [Thermodesulfobacteriota bacterium]|nr:radical SAM protein [Thermodesulfobacteriota bacterium]